MTGGKVSTMYASEGERPKDSQREVDDHYCKEEGRYFAGVRMTMDRGASCGWQHGSLKYQSTETGGMRRRTGARTRNNATCGRLECDHQKRMRRLVVVVRCTGIVHCRPKTLVGPEADVSLACSRPVR